MASKEDAKAQAQHEKVVGWVQRATEKDAFVVFMMEKMAAIGWCVEGVIVFLIMFNFNLFHARQTALLTWWDTCTAQ